MFKVIKEIFIVEADHWEAFTGDVVTEEIAAFESKDEADDFIELYKDYLQIYNRISMWETCFLSVRSIILRYNRPTKRTRYINTLKERSLVIQKAFMDMSYYYK